MGRREGEGDVRVRTGVVILDRRCYGDLAVRDHQVEESITLEVPVMCVFVGMTVTPVTVKYCKAYAAR